MNTTKALVVVSIALALGVSSAANAAKKNKEQDSAYQWGRWAVLSPAAGGEPYVAPVAPAAANNARPGEADEFQPAVVVPVTDDPRDRLPPRPPPVVIPDDPRDRLPPRPPVL